MQLSGVETSMQLMQFCGVATSTPAKPRPRCRHKNLNEPLRRSDACCPNCASWTDTSVAPLRSETELFSTSVQSEVVIGKTEPIFLNLSKGLKTSNSLSRSNGSGMSP